MNKVWITMIVLSLAGCKTVDNVIIPPKFENMNVQEGSWNRYFPNKAGYSLFYTVSDSISRDEGRFELTFQDITLLGNNAPMVFSTFNNVNDNRLGSSLGGRISTLNGKQIFSFYTGQNSRNSGNIFFFVQVPAIIEEDLVWSDSFGVTYKLTNNGDYLINGVKYKNCLLIEFDSSDVTNEKAYCKNGKGFYVLSKDIGLVDFQFSSNEGKRISIVLNEFKQNKDKTTISGLIKNFDSQSQIGVMISGRLIDSLFKIDSRGRFNIEFWGSVTSLYFGELNEKDEFIEGQKLKYFKIRNISNNNSQVEIEWKNI